ncbi:MAG TPA: hypothetical protein VM694_28020 [Polyangium sp.]|nr:hypothetical protein [Polyangium sp.]
MMRRFVNSLCASRLLRRGMLAALTGCAALALSAGAEAQEIQLTGPLAGAPAVRKLRLHRAGRIEITPSASFTLLDEYQRTIMPGLRVMYHPTDWIGFGVWGGYGIQTTTSLTDELQVKAIDERNCPTDSNTATDTACKLTAVNLTRGNLAQDQLGRMQWVAAPQVTVVPFRGKLALFATLFVDTDISFFVGPAVIGVQERAPCGKDNDGNSLTDRPCAAQSSFQLESRIAIAPTFGVGWNFYPTSFFGFGAEWRALPFAWNTSGFDNAGSGNDEAFPDTAVNNKDRQFRFNSMVSVNLMFSLPMKVKNSD